VREHNLSSVDLLKGKRTAVVVGINTYKDTGIPQLSGAENDAQELFNLLTSQEAKFENNAKNLILGEEATQRNIVERISEIFRNDEKYEIALFYFSGHGFLDKKEELYLATHDVRGIRIDDLRRQIYSSENKQNAILVLDCCFSGTATKDTKGEGSDIQDPRLYLETNIGYNAEKEQYGEGEGKFTITSTAADKVSYEVKDCTHQENSQPHVHGALTYYLLQGLEGAAADANSGKITLGSLQQYIDTKMYNDRKQKSYTHGSQVTNINNILIALSITKYKDNIKNLENEITQYLDIPDTSFPIIKYVIAGAKKLKELKSINPTNQSITTINERITSQLELYRRGVFDWCIALTDDIVFKIENNTTRGFVDDFRSQVGALQCNTLADIDEKWKNFLNSIGNEVRNNTKYTDKNDPKLGTLLANLSANYKLFREGSK
jgi:caspase domain-containing protein